ncbi:MAG: hypothetical protein AAFX93_19240 [Verrucomicrobiota bacterium]
MSAHSSPQNEQQPSTNPKPEKEIQGHAVHIANPDGTRESSSRHARPPSDAHRCAPTRSAERPDGEAVLPCRKSNNSTELPSGYDLSKGKPLVWSDSQIKEAKHIKFDSGRRQLVEYDGVQEWLNGPSTSEKKKAFALVENIKHLVNLYGIERLGFLTLTFEDNVTDFREAQRRFNSLATHILRNLFENYVVTVEPQKRGAVHYHLVVACQSDIRTGFHFDAFRASQIAFRKNGRCSDYFQLRQMYAESASPYLRNLWSFLRRKMKDYGFGRAELLPIRSNADGIAHYVGKYLEKGSRYRGEQFKGARMVRYSRGWRAVSQNFSWIETGQRWRRTIAQVAHLIGADDIEDLSNKAGRYWAFKALAILKVFPDANPVEIARVLATQTY